MNNNVVVFSRVNQNEESETSSALPDQMESQVEYLKTKVKLCTQTLKTQEAQIKQLRQENEKLRQLNADYVNQMNQMASDKYQKIEKIVVTQQFFEQKNIDKQLKDFIRKMTSNFGGLEKSHVKLIDHCKVMEHDLNYYKQRVVDAEEIIENLRSVGKNSVAELMDELKGLQNQVDDLTNHLQKSQFDLAVKQGELERKQQELDDQVAYCEQLLHEIDDIKTKQNRILSDNIEQQNKDAKMIYQLKLKSDFLEHERRLAYQDAQCANQERNTMLAKQQNIETELDMLRTTTDNFLKKNKHIFNLAGLPKVQFK
ncbi:unnamed protein product [Paramecium sonneborni]|uniref:Uncharacterized protein n=1 Tax=Paramecium sonneborni TaxID=65129 RepID=A0A8S1JV51_9CILI|nr:unnamed protein product [Paramecium sonneborni]